MRIRDRHKITPYFAALILASLTIGCAPQSDAPMTLERYSTLSDAEKTVTLHEMAELFDRHQTANPTGLDVTHIVDTSGNKIIARGVYPKKVSPKQLAKAEAVSRKLHSAFDFCAQPPMQKLTAMGIGYQAIMVDQAGTQLYASEICQSATDKPKLRGLSASR